MRRASVNRLQSQTSEPVIVVEEEQEIDQSEELARSTNSSQHSSEDESGNLNPFLLSPGYLARDVRKHSLPTPQCSGITASQIRRLSDRGETAPGPRQAEFLATLSQAPQISPGGGGRRHSVVTISKMPQMLFGKNRRESVAAVPTRILPNRRESIACPPSSTDSRGSVHNLQLDIMDDIVQARKVRMKVWNTSSEKLCEVQPLADENATGNVQRYTNSNRRFSDFIGTTLPPILSASKRRASELPPISTCTSKQKPGIVCSNTDLYSILSSLSPSTTDINEKLEKEVVTPPPRPKPAARIIKPAKDWNDKSGSTASPSNFDGSSLLKNLEKSLSASQKQLFPNFSASTSPSNWFAKKQQQPSSSSLSASASASTSTTQTSNKISEKMSFLDGIRKKPGKVVWDDKSGSLINAHAIGSAIEGFLRQSTPDSPNNTSQKERRSPSKGNKLTDKVLDAANKIKSNNWLFKEAEEEDTCDSSLCGTLKDLFVK